MEEGAGRPSEFARSFLDALELIAEPLRHGEAGAVASVRRLARSLRRRAAAGGFLDVALAAEALEKSAAGKPLDGLEPLLTALGRQAAGPARDGFLIVGSAEAAKLIAALAPRGGEPVIASSCAEAVRHLRARRFDLVIVDMAVLDADGRSLLARLKEHPSTAGIPVIVLSVSGNEAERRECVALGADAWLKAPVDPGELAAAVEGILARESAALAASHRDALTGLPNRTVLGETFERAKAEAVRTGKPLVLALLELDDVTGLHEAFGRVILDMVLREAGAGVARSLRRSDFVARWGGAQFAALLPATALAGGRRALKKVLDAARARTFRSGDGITFHLTLSAGFTRVSADMSAESAVATIGELLRQARAEGRSAVLVPEAAELELAEAPKILIAEYDDLAAAAMKHRLSREGYEVVHCADGASALQAAVDPSVSLVLLDLQTPSIGGLQLLEVLRRRPETAKVPVIMLTTPEDEDAVGRAIELGAADCVVKPVSPVDLLARVRRCLGTS
ncbi:MAG: response regulator [Nitrospirae bacterium]|nr:response regulator [Nitrospirota bacterium]